VLLSSAELVTDINTVTVGSEPRHFTAAANGITYFDAATSSAGRELWKTDGSAAGTVLVKDIRAGKDDAFQESFPTPLDPEFTPAGNTTFFVAEDGSHGPELWKTDGTGAGTVLVKDIRPGRTGSAPRQLTALGNLLLFAVDDGAGAGLELWRSDGTDAGTVQVKDIDPRAGAGSNPDGLVASGGRVYFAATTEAAGRELWSSNGTTDGTVLVKDVRAGTAGSNPANLFDAAGTLYFDASADSDVRPTLWKTAGTAASTAQVSPLLVDPTVPMARLGTSVFFASSATGDPELYKTDGTPAGTSRVADVYPGGQGSSPRDLTVLGQNLYFVAAGVDGSGQPIGRELYKTNGTPAGTTLVKDVNVSGQANVYGLTVAASKLFFTARDDNRGTRQLWATDGTAAGTVPLGDVQHDNIPAEVVRPAPVGTRLVYPGMDTPSGAELWLTDGTAAGTARLKDINTTTAGASLGNEAMFNGKLYFSGDDGHHGSELWVTDGTADGTRMVADLGNRLNYYGPQALTPFNGRLYFATNSGDNTSFSELWSTDGTADGTRQVKDITDVGFAITQMTVLDGALYFISQSNRNQPLLWKSDGTTAGTTLVKDFGPPPVPATWRGAGLTSIAGALYFTTYEERNGDTFRGILWRSDGTPDGTVALHEFGTQMNYPSFAAVGDRVFFAADDPLLGLGRELWVTDGTPEGTHLVKDIYPGRLQSDPRSLTAWRGRVWFTGVAPGANGVGSSIGLFSSDGTAEGTVRVDGPARGTAPADLFLYNDALYFRGRSTADVSTDQLWRSDGTDAGTRAVTFTQPGRRDLTPAFFTEVNDMLLFTDIRTLRLYVSDGTTAGTAEVSGDYQTYGSLPVAVGDKVLFKGFNDTVGLEWFRTTVVAPPAVVGRWVYYNHSEFDRNDAAANAVDDNAIAMDKAALLPGTTGTFANVTSYTRGINGVMVDVRGLPNGTLSADDFQFRMRGPSGWTDAPAPSQLSVRRGAGADGSDRISFTWPDNAVRNTWLEVTVKANARTGLTAPDVFSFGNLVGATQATRVGALDLAAVRRAINSTAAIGSITDINRDGRVNSLDLAAVRSSLLRMLEPVSLAVLDTSRDFV
jgi:ELWxxDGT repeat protein